METAARSARDVHVADEYLTSVLAGKDYLLFDGAMGTMLQTLGIELEGPAELLCLERPEVVTDVHRRYVQAGCMAVTTNTFAASSLKLGDSASVDDVFAAAIDCARESGARYVAADIGPLGELLEPFGDLEQEEAADLFAEQARAAQAHGADIVIIETMADLAEMRAAVAAAR